jgi:hypothetical protein
MVEFKGATHRNFWEWVYADKLSGCQGLITALEEQEGHVEEVESDESEEEESEESEESEEELEELEESEEELEAAPEVEGEEGEEGDALLRLEHVVKTEGTPRSSFFQPHNTLSQTQQRATSAPAALWTKDS